MLNLYPKESLELWCCPPTNSYETTLLTGANFNQHFVINPLLNCSVQNLNYET